MTNAFTQHELDRFASAYTLLDAGPTLTEVTRQVLAFIATTQDFDRRDIQEAIRVEHFKELDSGKVQKCLQEIRRLSKQR